MTTILVKNLTRTYEYYKKEPGMKATLQSLFHRKKLKKQAVDNISFEIEEGELVGFLGPNGSGKTTTLKMLSGIIHPTSGTASVLGYTPWERHRKFLSSMAIVMGQKAQLWWELQTTESFLLSKEIYGVSDHDYKRRMNELVELLGVTDVLGTQVRKMSLGQRMKCELIAALIHQPNVIYLDEPTIGLDVVSQQKIREFINVYNKENNATIILTSHYMEDVQRLCKRVIIIDHGEILYDGDLNTLIKRYINHKVMIVTFMRDVKLQNFQKYGFVKEFAPRRLVIEVGEKEYKKVATVFLNKLPVDDILINEVSIEEVVRKIFEDSEKL